MNSMTFNMEDLIALGNVLLLAANAFGVAYTKRLNDKISDLQNKVIELKEENETLNRTVVTLREQIISLTTERTLLYQKMLGIGGKDERPK